MLLGTYLVTMVIHFQAGTHDCPFEKLGNLHIVFACLASTLACAVETVTSFTKAYIVSSSVHQILFLVHLMVW